MCVSQRQLRSLNAMRGWCDKTGIWAHGATAQRDCWAVTGLIQTPSNISHSFRTQWGKRGAIKQISYNLPWVSARKESGNINNLATESWQKSRPVSVVQLWQVQWEKRNPAGENRCPEITGSCLRPSTPSVNVVYSRRVAPVCPGPTCCSHALRTDAAAAPESGALYTGDTQAQCVHTTTRKARAILTCAFLIYSRAAGRKYHHVPLKVAIHQCKNTPKSCILHAKPWLRLVKYK